MVRMGTFNVEIKGRMTFDGETMQRAMDAIDEFIDAHTEKGVSCLVKITVPQDIWREQTKALKAKAAASKAPKVEEAPQPRVKEASFQFAKSRVPSGSARTAKRRSKT